MKCSSCGAGCRRHRAFRLDIRQSEGAACVRTAQAVTFTRPFPCAAVRLVAGGAWAHNGETVLSASRRQVHGDGRPGGHDGADDNRGQQVGAEARCVASFISNRSYVSIAMFQSIPMQALCTTSRTCPAAPPVTRLPPMLRPRAALARRLKSKPVRSCIALDSVLLNDGRCIPLPRRRPHA